jgi:hypothetical protein
MISDAYATVEQYRALTGKTDTAADSLIITDLLAISRYLDGKLGRYFNKDLSDTTRLYMPDSAITTLYIEDVVAITEVALESGDSFDALTDYTLLPLNADKQPEPRPFSAIKLRSSVFPADTQVRVTGIHGWPAVPDAVQRATIHLAAILRIESPRATRRISELGDSIETSDDAMSIIRQLTDRYRRVSYV